MTDNPDGVSLREFIDLRFSGIERELSQLRSAVEKLAVDMVTGQEFKRIQTEVDSLRQRTEALEGRANQSDSNWRIVRVVLGAIGIVLIPIIVEVVKAWLGP